MHWSSLFTAPEASSKSEPITWSAPPINAISLHYPYLEKIAVVSEAIALGQSGRIYLDNTWWRARCRQSLDLPVGTPVRVKSRDQLTLWVEPMDTNQPIHS